MAGNRKYLSEYVFQYDSLLANNYIISPGTKKEI
jgi:hypothetical protein